MIKVENVRIFGLDEILHTRMSFRDIDDLKLSKTVEDNDLNLMDKLKKAGDSHAKILRFITVLMTITLPRRVWVDFDTYRLGREDIKPDDIEYFSESTMHTISKRLLESSDFDEYTSTLAINTVNRYIKENKDNPSEENFLRIKSNLPEGMLQTRRVKLNYQSLRHIYTDRHLHKQPEFRQFCDIIKTLPYARDLII